MTDKHVFFIGGVCLIILTLLGWVKYGPIEGAICYLIVSVYILVGSKVIERKRKMKDET